MKAIKKAIFTCTIFISGAAFSGEYSAEFGIIEYNKKAGWHIKEETLAIPYYPSTNDRESFQLYGVIVRSVGGKPFKGHAVHYYPGPSISWLPFDDPQGIDKRKLSVSRFEPEYATSGFWASIETLHEGDPLGDHKIEVYINDKLERVFKFSVIPPK